MIIPLIPKNPDLNDFTCRDGEIDFIYPLNTARNASTLSCETDIINSSLITNHSSLEKTIRIPLQKGDKEKAELMLSGQISRVDPETADRLTQAIVQKAAECLLDLSTDLRRQGLFILPFRFYTMTMLPDGTLSYPGPQAVALPTDHPPQPEITAASATDDTLTLAIRFPVQPHRLTVSPTDKLPAGCGMRIFISYPLYIPDPKEMRGSIGSVRSASGIQTTGIRFTFLSNSAIKASVAAPEKYYELVGNQRTGYRLSSKSAATPDYSCYAGDYGYVPPFPRESLLAPGEGVDGDTDPLDWIADWIAATDPQDTEKEGYLPAFLPYKYRYPSEATDASAIAWPEGIDHKMINDIADSIDATGILLTRPMTFASDSISRRHAEARSVITLHLLGLPSESPALALLYGSDDGVRWSPLRRFDPRVKSMLLTPPRLFWRLLVIGSIGQPALGVAITFR